MDPISRHLTVRGASEAEGGCKSFGLMSRKSPRVIRRPYLAPWQWHESTAM
jgi:hypothetical protein